MKIEFQGDHWLASGDGPEGNVLLVEAATRPLAQKAWLIDYGNLYAMSESKTALSLLSEGRREQKLQDARMLAQDIRRAI